jgi:hypothetical protein
MFERQGPPTLTVAQILAWADAHHARTGQWPKTTTGPVTNGLLGDNSRKIDNGLRYGLRGLPGGSSLARLLDEERSVRNMRNLPPLAEADILAWADRHRCRTGHWPSENSGPVTDAPGEVWLNVNQALVDGLRGLPGGDSLARLIARGRRVTNRTNLPQLTEEKIIALADVHQRRTDQWPTLKSGRVIGAGRESWQAMDDALRQGHRGLPGGSSLAQLLAEHRGVRNKAALPRLRLRQVRVWAKAHRERTGNWPTAASGHLPEAPGETWAAVNAALSEGLRGLSGGSSLSRLLQPGKRRATATGHGRGRGRKP